ncbi:MAG: HlyC/CorC family transporter, partial [Clostridiales bacterium]|nr:HlyC/CorC family transporter [Clostridiales bacterium]
EDILEELVGEIWDEHDEVVEDFRQISERVYRVSCGANLEDMFQLFRLNVDTEDFDFSTISGWVMQQLGKIPAPGDRFDYENLHVTVTKTDMRRVLEIEVGVDPASKGEQ